MTASLDRLLRPRSIAVLGGSWARNVVSQCIKAGFDGDVWPVHPERESVEGLRCYARLEDLPAPPDAVFIGVNRHATIDVVGKLREMGAGGAVCFASGFLEAQSLTGDGQALQDALIDAAGDMPVLGPNCYGFINYLDGALLWPDQHGGVSLGTDGRGVALVMQSSNIAINCTMQSRGLPLAYVLCVGNQACVDLSTLVEGLLGDDRVSAIGLHIEGIADTDGFERVALKARRAGKPLVAIKVGRSREARQASMTHTASVAGSDAGSRAFFRQLGVPLVNALPTLLETLKLLHVHGPIAGRSISSMSCSGGEASLVADAAESYKLEFTALREDDKHRVQATLSELVVPANPLDYHTFIWGDEARMTATFAALMQTGFDLNFLILDFPRVDRCSDADWDPAVSAIAQAADRANATVAVVTSLPENLPEERSAELMMHGIAPLHGLDDALQAAEAAASIGEAWRGPEPELWPTRAKKERARGPTDTLTEFESKSLLANAGLVVPRVQLCSSVDAACAAAHTLGFPVVAKISGNAHKTDEAGVRLDLTSEADVQNAASALLEKTDTILIESMVTDVVAELLVGVHRDPVYGELLTIGSGGTLVELLGDVLTLRLPVDGDAVLRALQSLRAWPLVEGYRGGAPGDVDAAVASVLQLQAFVKAQRHAVTEIDLNPVLVLPRGRGVVVADALIVGARDDLI